MTIAHHITLNPQITNLLLLYIKKYKTKHTTKNTQKNKNPPPPPPPPPPQHKRDSGTVAVGNFQKAIGSSYHVRVADVRTARDSLRSVPSRNSTGRSSSFTAVEELLTFLAHGSA
jgi:hypothetical protein